VRRVSGQMFNSGIAIPVWALCLLGAVALSGCMSASLEDAAPTTAQNPQPPRDTSFVAEGALRNDTYPTFAGTPVGATDQLSAAETEQLEAEMEEIRDAYGAGALSAADYQARLRDLQAIARSHADEAKKAIED